jgi:hypothetical protein
MAEMASAETAELVALQLLQESARPLVAARQALN